jgi:predicted phage terminase large subunit-like protein
MAAAVKKQEPSATEKLEAQLKLVTRLTQLKRARDNLIDFTTMSMPHPEDPSDSERSRYVPAMHHKLIARALEKVETGEWPRLIITMPPRHGKTELASKRFPAWFVGRDPYRAVIAATYADEYAEELGREVREIMKSPFYTQVFPGTKLRRGSQASNRLQTEAGGILVFVGRKGRLTGRGGDVLLIDDPVKDSEEASSPTIRNKIWDWFTDTAMSRMMTDAARVVVIMTRWHEDDIVGRLTDPESAYYNAEEAAKWKILKLPALAEENDPLGRAPGEALWPDRIGREFLEAQRRLSPRGFEALYQGNPAPDDGEFFKAAWIKDNLYKPEELPRNLRYYIASDHAVSTAQERDATCMLVAGVDTEGTIWLVDCWWHRKQTDDVVDAMLELGGRWRPLTWWAERGHISKSIGPFLRRRMFESQTYFRIEEVVPVADKQTRAQAIQGRMSMGKVKFPSFAPWFGRAFQEVIKFPAAKHDDFVDTLALLGLGLSRIVAANDATKAADAAAKQPQVGTLAWVKESSRKLLRDRQFRNRGM